MKNILIINGPNLNLIGIRQPEIYGTKSLDDYFETLKKKFSNCQLTVQQSNHEGDIINALHEYGFIYDGIILNAGGYTYTSVAIGDAIAAISTTVIQVISDAYSRKSFRQPSLLSANCIGTIAGFGLESYELALQYFLSQPQNNDIIKEVI